MKVRTTMFRSWPQLLSKAGFSVHIRIGLVDLQVDIDVSEKHALYPEEGGSMLLRNVGF
jgi:hypothetical protein